MASLEVMFKDRPAQYCTGSLNPHPWLSKYTVFRYIFKTVVTTPVQTTHSRVMLVCLFTVAASGKVSSWLQFTRNSHYNDLSRWQLSTDLYNVPATQLNGQQKGHPNKPLALSHSPSPEKQCSFVLNLDI